jgi:hypothetical protein
LPKSVAFLPRYAAVSAAANHRYREALAVVDDPAPAQRALDRLGQPVRDSQVRSSRAFNPAATTDLAAWLRSSVVNTPSMAFVRTQLFGAVDPRRKAQVTRLERLHLRGLVATFPRSRRGRVTQLGHATMSAAVLLREEEFPAVFLKTAA